MIYKGMGCRNHAEMAAAMVLPVLPFLDLVWFGITPSAQCGGYCLASIAAMYLLMRIRRGEYTRSM